MSSGIGSTLTGGIQDVAAILPLLGTEQCSIHVSSALTKGYLYAASAPMSIFGSLGVVSAGFKTLVACISYRRVEGARILENLGFEPQGENLSLIMLEDDKEKVKGRYIIENRIDAWIDELNIDKARITGISPKSAAWNIEMMVTTALFCAISITPYIYINLGATNLNLKKGTIWAFPILRSTGGFITATLIQLLIQRRITALSHQYLVYPDLLNSRNDEETGCAKKLQKIARRITPTWLLQFFLFIGLLASVVGYVGCFSIVQNSASSLGPVSWLCLEIGLSVARMAIWGLNPESDDAPPLEINFELDKHEPLPTCNKDNEEIIKHKVLPLTLAQDFLKSINSFIGPIRPFNNPNLSLYYTLTRKCAYKEGVLSENFDPWDGERHKPGERTLYITVFDHKERTTRVYSRDDEVETIYSTKSDAPLVDVGHFILEVEIDAKIDPKSDPVCKNGDNMYLIREHHRSILAHIQGRLGAGDITITYALGISWIMKAEDTISTLHRLREGNCEAVVEKGREEERTYELVVSDYFMHSSIERERRWLDESRGEWISRRMKMISEETKERLLGTGVEYRVYKQAVEKQPIKTPEVKEMLGDEQCAMELLLVCEVKQWEQLFWNKFKSFLVQISKYRVGETERLTREWTANCWKRLNSQRDAALKRMADVDDFKGKVDELERLRGQSAKCIRQFFERVENGITLPILRREIRRIGLIGLIRDKDSSDRMQIEIEDAEFRLKRGSELGRFDQFWDDDTLFNCRYSRSKWLHFWIYSKTPLEVYSHYLKGNKNITHIKFGLMDPGFDVNRFLCDLPWVTSITPDRSMTIPAVPRELLFIESNDLNTFAKEIKLIKSDSSSTYIFFDARNYDVYSDKLGGNARVLISFVAPNSGKRLILRVEHSGDEEDPPLEVTLGSNIHLNPSSKSSLTIDDITIYPIEVSNPSDLSFVPEVRNDIFIRFIGTDKHSKHRHFLHDIGLLDENGLEYMPHSASLSVPSN